RPDAAMHGGTRAARQGVRPPGRRSRRAALRPPTEPAGCAAHARSQSGRKAVPQQASGDDAACSPLHWDAVEWLAPSRTEPRGHSRTPLVRDLSGYRRENPAGPDSSPILGRDMPLHLKYRSLRVLEQGAERRNCRCERGLTSVRAVLYFKARRAVPPILPPSSSGLGHLVLSQETGVRFPVGVLAGKPANAPELGRRLAGPLRWRRLQHRRARRAQLVRSHSSVAFGDFTGRDSTGALVAWIAGHIDRGR